MRAYASHERAARKLQEIFEKTQRIEFYYLLDYLREVSQEPNGEDAYRLALCLRTMNLPARNLLTLVKEARHESSHHNIGAERLNRTIREHLDNAGRFLAANLAQEKDESSHFEDAEQKGKDTEKKPRLSASNNNDNKDPKFATAYSQGSEISRSIYNYYKDILINNMAALSLFWTCFEPSIQSSEESICLY